MNWTNQNSILDGKPHNISTLPQKSLATLDDEIVDPEITVKLEMRDAET